MNSNRARNDDKTNRPIPTCRDEVGLIGEYLTNQLSKSERVPFETHLSDCPDCRAFLATYKKTTQLSRDFLRSRLRVEPQSHSTLRR